MTLSPTELEALSRLSHEAVARLTLPRSRETRKAERTMSEQIVQQPAFERQKRETNGHTSVANRHNAPDGPRCGGLIPPICSIGLVFYALAWRATRRMQ